MRKLILAVVIVLTLVLSCKKQDIDLDKLSTEVELPHAGVMPLIEGSFFIDDFLSGEENEYFIIDGDTVTLVYSIDSLLGYTFQTFTTIPEQTTLNYIISPKNDIPIAWFGDEIVNDSLRLDTIGINEPYNFNLDSLRLDRMVLKTGEVQISIENEFPMDILLEITSTNLFDPYGNQLRELVRVGAEQEKPHTVPLNDYEFHFKKDNEDNITINFNIVPTFYIIDESGILEAEDSIKIDFKIADVNDFKSIHGYFGQYTVDSTVNFTFGDVEALKNVEGMFNVTNPRFKLNYDVGFDMPLGLYLDIVTHRGSESNIIDMGDRIVPLNNQYVGSVDFNKESVPNIDKLISFPFPDSISVTGRVQANPGGNEFTDTNAVFDTSDFKLGLDLEIPLEIAADLTYDTNFSIMNMVGNLRDNGIDMINYVYLHHEIVNGFPFGMGVKFALYDSINNVTFADTLYIGNKTSGLLLDPAPVNTNGEVIKNEIKVVKDTIEITGEQAAFLLNEATHLVMSAKFLTTDASSVNIYYNYTLDFFFKLEYDVTFSSNP